MTVLWKEKKAICSCGEKIIIPVGHDTNYGQTICRKCSNFVVFDDGKTFVADRSSFRIVKKNAAQPRVHLTSGGRGKNKGRVVTATRR